MKPGNEDIMINVAEFSTYPIGRDDRDGAYNGERFRRDWLMPALRDAIARDVKVVVSFKGVLSFGSSFLEEAFGGLVSKEGVAKDVVKRKVQILVIPGDPDRYDGVVADMIDEARPA